MLSTGQNYKQVALHLIQKFLRDHDMETTLYALEIEAEEDLQEHPQLPNASLLGILESYMQSNNHIKYH